MERADAHAGGEGDLVRARSLVAVADENASGRGEEGIHGRA